MEPAWLPSRATSRSGTSSLHPATAWNGNLLQKGGGNHGHDQNRGPDEEDVMYGIRQTKPDGVDHLVEHRSCRRGQRGPDMREVVRIEYRLRAAADRNPTKKLRRKVEGRHLALDMGRQSVGENRAENGRSNHPSKVAPELHLSRGHPDYLLPRGHLHHRDGYWELQC